MREEMKKEFDEIEYLAIGRVLERLTPSTDAEIQEEMDKIDRVLGGEDEALETAKKKIYGFGLVKFQCEVLNEILTIARDDARGGK